jgi:hypothetical protein
MVWKHLKIPSPCSMYLRHSSLLVDLSTIVRSYQMSCLHRSPDLYAVGRGAQHLTLVGIKVRISMVYFWYKSLLTYFSRDLSLKVKFSRHFCISSHCFSNEPCDELAGNLIPPAGLLSSSNYKLSRREDLEICLVLLGTCWGLLNWASRNRKTLLLLL